MNRALSSECERLVRAIVAINEETQKSENQLKEIKKQAECASKQLPDLVFRIQSLEEELETYKQKNAEKKGILLEKRENNKSINQQIDMLKKCCSILEQVNSNIGNDMSIKDEICSSDIEKRIESIMEYIQNESIILDENILLQEKNNLMRKCNDLNKEISLLSPLVSDWPIDNDGLIAATDEFCFRYIDESFVQNHSSLNDVQDYNDGRESNIQTQNAKKSQPKGKYQIKGLTTQIEYATKYLIDLYIHVTSCLNDQTRFANFLINILTKHNLKTQSISSHIKKEFLAMAEIPTLTPVEIHRRSAGSDADLLEDLLNDFSHYIQEKLKSLVSISSLSHVSDAILNIDFKLPETQSRNTTIKSSVVDSDLTKASINMQEMSSVVSSMVPIHDIASVSKSYSSILNPITNDNFNYNIDNKKPIESEYISTPTPDTSFINDYIISTIEKLPKSVTKLLEETQHDFQFPPIKQDQTIIEQEPFSIGFEKNPVPILAESSNPALRLISQMALPVLELKETKTSEMPSITDQCPNIDGILNSIDVILSPEHQSQAYKEAHVVEISKVRHSIDQGIVEDITGIENIAKELSNTKKTIKNSKHEKINEINNEKAKILELTKQIEHLGEAKYQNDAKKIELMQMKEQIQKLENLMEELESEVFRIQLTKSMI